VVERQATRSVIVGATAATCVVVAGLLVAAAKRCIDSPEFYDWTPLVYAWAGCAAMVIGALAMRTNTRLGLPLLVIGALLLGVVIGGPPFKGCEQFQMFRPD
jgi:hypothetical protein